MSRRGEVPFVAVRVGRSNDPREVGDLARMLRVARPHALGFLVLWEEFILEVGDAATGKVQGYSAAHIAEKLGFTGAPKKLIDALKHVGVLSFQRGVFRHPTWADSITGQYAIRKAVDRDVWARQKQAQRDAARAAALAAAGGHVVDVHQMSTWTGGGHPPGVQVENGQKERKESSGHLPPAPPQAGGGLGASRWDWMLEHHPNPRKPRESQLLLAALTDENWALIQWALTPSATGGGLTYLSKKRAGLRDSHKFLTSGAYLSVRREWTEKLRETTARTDRNGKAEPRPDPALEREAQKASGIAFLLALLKDSSEPESKKKFHRDRWLRENPGEAPPWEAVEPVDAPATAN